VRDGAPCGERVDLTGLDDASGGTLLAPKKGSERRSPYKCAIRLSRGLSLSRIFVLLACAALEAGGARSSSHGYSNPNAGYGTAAFSHYKAGKSHVSGPAVSYAPVPQGVPVQQEGLGSSKIAKGILLSIRVVNPDESSGQPTYAAQVPIHFSGGRVHTGPVVYGREQPCPEDHQHGQQLQSVQVDGYGARPGHVYQSSYQNALAAAKSYGVGQQQIQLAVPSNAKTFQYHGQSYAVPVSAVPATASQEDTKSYVAYAGPGQGQHYHQSYQVSHGHSPAYQGGQVSAPSAAYQGGQFSAQSVAYQGLPPASAQAFAEGKPYTYTANGQTFQVVQQTVSEGEQPGYGHGGGHGGHGGQVSPKGYGAYSVQDSYSIAASPAKSYGGGGSGEASGPAGNAIGAHHLQYEVSGASSGKGGYGGGGGGGGYAGGPSYGGSGSYGRPGYQVSSYPAGQSSYGISPTAYKSSDGGKSSYGSYGGGSGEQTYIVSADGGQGYKGEELSKSYPSYSGSGPSYGGSSGPAHKGHHYGGTAQQSFNQYTDPSSFYSGSPYAQANRLALLKYNTLMSRATSVLGANTNLKEISTRYNPGWN
ncbi:unnamed protein product, partial [Ixodes persulcatus]